MLLRTVRLYFVTKYSAIFFFQSCTVRFYVIKSFIRPTNAQFSYSKILNFTLRFTINAPTCFWFKQTIIREPTVCASLKLQYWRQLKYFVIELFGRVAAC